jgi:hypothetical protein
MGAGAAKGRRREPPGYVARRTPFTHQACELFRLPFPLDAPSNSLATESILRAGDFMRLLRRSALFCPHLAHSAVAPRLLVVLISLVIAGASGARAQNIDTTPAWNGTSSLNSWGEPNTATYAQTITAPSTPNLTSFTFYLAQINGVAPSFQAHVYAWDNLNGRATGSALFSSAIMVAPVSSSFTPVTINTGATQLTPGQRYVLLLTTAGLPNPAAGDYKWGYTQTNSYTGGRRFQQQWR